MKIPQRIVIAVALAAAAASARATYHTYQIDELYSNADGTVQYVVLHEALGMNGENQLAGHTLTATRGAATKTYVFSADLPGGPCDYYSCMAAMTANTRVLIATDGFAALGLVTPDYVVPNGFLPVNGGTVNYAGVDQVTYAALPTDGVNALWRDGSTRPNVARNFADASGSVAAGPPAPPAAAVAIGPGFTGVWNDPNQNRHGIFVEVLPGNGFLAWWFTFTPDGTQQSWFGGVGTYSGSTATISAVNLTTGGQWIPNFDASKVKDNPWGTLTFTFTDCNHGRVDFVSTFPGYGSNHMELTRVTLPGGLTCP